MLLSPWDRPVPLTILPAYGIDSNAGVVPLALVHSNRLRQEVAAVLGTFFNYRAEPLTGISHPCPPGPGVRQPWSEFPVPWVFIHVPLAYYGEEQARRYAEEREARRPRCCVGEQEE